MTVLETPRLRLRQWREADFEAYAAYYADETMAQFVGGRMDRARAWRHMAAIAGHWLLRGFGIWAVEEKTSGAFAGAVGPWMPEGWPELEIGYWLVQSRQGLGYATEAAAAAREHAWHVLNATTLVSYIDPDNVPSKRVAERLGARFERIIELSNVGPHCVYRHPAPGMA